MQKEEAAKSTSKGTGGVWDSTSGNEMLVTGAAVGTFGTAAALLAGFVCPVCTVATPLLLGGGVVKKLQERKRKPTPETPA